jgi:nucleotide-binding universal stress UspA family protein
MKVAHILVATDFSDDAKAALETALSFAKAFGSKLHLVHSYHLEVPAIYGGFAGDFAIPQDVLEPIRQGAKAALDDLLGELAGRGVEVDGRVVMDYPSHAILEEADRVAADLIVMGTRGLTGLKHVLVGSTAERIVRLAHCPVLTVKSPAPK